MAALVEDEVIDISSDEDEITQDDRRAILEPAIIDVVAAIGGMEGDKYRLGDEAYGCLKDLKKFWRKDDTDDERTVARIFWKTRVLLNDLIPILLVTAGQGLTDDKRAIACTDLVCAMTWPIDISEELKELDDALDEGSDFTELIDSHLHYKAALLQPGVMNALLAIVLPCITKDKKTRQRRDTQIISVVLHLIRNLAFIKDLPPNTHVSSDRVELSSLQSKLVTTLSETHFLDFLLTIASNATSDSLLNEWNTIVLEIFYLLYRGVKPSTLLNNQAAESKKNLSRLLIAEDSLKREQLRKATSRHSRFGTTISVSLNPRKKAAPANANGEREAETPDGDAPEASSSRPSQPLLFHRQDAIRSSSGTMIDMKKKRAKGREIRVDELGRLDNLSVEARNVLQNAARTFVEACFNPFVSSVLKDVKAERAKITQKDGLRLIFVAKWFLEFFLLTRAAAAAKEKEKKSSDTTPNWGFELMSEVLERGWITWVLKRMREAVEEKPKQWVELQAGLECLTQMLVLIDSMLTTEDLAADLIDAAELLQHQLVYNGEILDIAFESLRSYKPGSQSLAYLNSSVHLGYLLLRMLERWSKMKGGEMYVRKRTRRKARKRAANGLQPEEEGVPDVEDPEDYGGEEDAMIQETIFTFESFEARFANADITSTLLVYLSRYREFDSPEYMKRVVSLLHRQAIRSKAEGLFFRASTLHLFQQVLTDQKSLPKDQPYKDLISLINFVLRKFFKSVAEDSFLLIEAFFPKNRNQWKAFSSWEPEEKQMVEDTRFPADVKIKKGYSWSQQLGIAIATLVEDGQLELIDWTKEILRTVITKKQNLIEETDGDDAIPLIEAPDPDDEDAEPQRGPSNEAMAKFEDFLIPYLSDEHADAATRNPRLKLVFRLVKFYILDETDELEWFVPAAIMPSELQRSYNIINQFLDSPIDLDGKKASQMLQKKPRPRRKRAPSPISDDDEAGGYVGSDTEGPRKRRRRAARKEKKAKEELKYKSAQFIEDSDAEADDEAAFFAREKELREKMELAAVDGKLASMHQTGTKKRRNKNPEAGGTRKKRKSEARPRKEDKEQDANNSSTDDIDGHAKPASAPEKRPRPKPKPKPKFGPNKDVEADDDSEPTSDGIPRSPPSPGRDGGSSLPKARPKPRFKPTRKAADDVSGEEDEPMSFTASVQSLEPSFDDDHEDVWVAPRPRKSRVVLSDDEDD